MADDVCVTCGTDIDSQVSLVSFEEAQAGFSSQKFWISFFIRPCCPAPKGPQAKIQLDKQRDLVRGREDWTEEQKAELLDLIDKGEAWYRKTPYWGSEA